MLKLTFDVALDEFCPWPVFWLASCINRKELALERERVLLKVDNTFNKLLFVEELVLGGGGGGAPLVADRGGQGGGSYEEDCADEADEESVGGCDGDADIGGCLTGLPTWVN